MKKMMRKTNGETLSENDRYVNLPVSEGGFPCFSTIELLVKRQLTNGHENCAFPMGHP
jgi:hypothetical protein